MSEFNIEVAGGASVRLPTAGKYCDRDIVVTASGVNADDYLAAVCNKEVKEIISDKVLQVSVNFQNNNAVLEKVILRELTALPESTFTSCSKLSTVWLPKVTTMGAGNFGSCRALTKIYMPSLASITGWGYSFNWSALQKAYFPKLTSITAYDFANCRELTRFVLGTPSVCTLAAANAFESTPISGNTYETDGELGYIYVPSALVSSYKTATNWATFASQIRAIEDYPEVLEGWE